MLFEEPRPAPAAKVISTVDDNPRVCVDFRERRAGTTANPWSEAGIRFEVRGADGELLPLGRIERWSAAQPLGLNAGFRLSDDDVISLTGYATQSRQTEGSAAPFSEVSVRLGYTRSFTVVK